MEEQCSPLTWSYYYQDNGIEELKYSLLYCTLELESQVVSAHEEISRKDDEILHLRSLLAKTLKERDEFKAKCQTLVLEKEFVLQKVVQMQTQVQQCAISSGNSSNEDESIDLSPLSSDEKIVKRPSVGYFQQKSEKASEGNTKTPQTPQAEMFDIIDKIALKKPLPEKGRFLKAVMEAGPLLQTLLLAGPLPQWKHPPPQLNSIDIPLVTLSSTSPTMEPSLSPHCSGGFSNKRSMMNTDWPDFSPKSKCQKVVHKSPLTQHIVSP